MDKLILVDTSTDNVTINNTDYTFVYDLPYIEKKKRVWGDDSRIIHEEIAAEILDEIQKGRKLKTCILIIESEHLADEHYDDPKYMHKTNELLICTAHQEARREFFNHHGRYFDRDAMQKFLEENKLPTWKHNFKEEEDNERKFKFEVEDAVFDYQEKLEMFDIIAKRLEDAKYKLDEYGWPLEREEQEEQEELQPEPECDTVSDAVSVKENDTDDLDEDDSDYLAEEDCYILETDPAVVKEQRRTLLHDLLRPQIEATYERVYDMPEPFNFWDGRSFWHQFFLAIDETTGQVLYNRGNSGSSGAREENGLWAHTFMYLAKKHGLETPTYHLLYNRHNELKFIEKYSETKVLPYDVSGNYHSNWKTVDELFEDRYAHSVRLQIDAEENKESKENEDENAEDSDENNEAIPPLE